MFGKMIKGALILGGLYTVYKVGYAIGLKKADPILQQLDKDLEMGKINAQEYLDKYNERIQVIEGGR